MELIFSRNTTVNGSIECVNVGIVNDQVLEGDHQMFEIILDSVIPFGNVEIGAFNVTTIKIADDEDDGMYILRSVVHTELS